jgi:hypothetical protein
LDAHAGVSVHARWPKNGTEWIEQGRVPAL